MFMHTLTVAVAVAGRVKTEQKADAMHGHLTIAQQGLAAGIVCLLLCVGSAVLASDESLKHFDLNAKPLGEELMDFGVQSGLTIAAPTSLTAGKIGSSMNGEMKPTDALRTLLAGTGLTFARSDNGAIAIQKSDEKSELSREKRPPPASESFSELQEIVITAEKHEETVQSTPLSVTAYSGADLQARGLVDLSDVGYETPGVSERNFGPGQTEYVMRGIASSAGESSTVGFYLDDIPLSAPDSSILGKVVIDPSLYDLNRVEVLRGPQGTLYGSGSMGGTIKLVTNQPDPTHFSASAQTIGSYTPDGGFNHGVNAMVNLPLIDNVLALRLVGSESYTDGWINRTVLNPFPSESNGGATRGDVLGAPIAQNYSNTNWEKTQGGRATLQWRPADGLSISPSVFVQTVTQGAPNFVDDPPGVQYETHYQPFDVAEPFSDSFELFSLPIKYDFGGFDLTEVTSYYRRQTHLTQDSSEIAQDFLEALIGIPKVSYANAGPLAYYETDHARQLTEEVRVNSSGAGPFQWLVGGFLQDFKPYTYVGSSTPGPIVEELFGAPSYVTVIFDNDIKQYAGFGEASYNFATNIKLTAGLRYYAYDLHVHLTSFGGLIGVSPDMPQTADLPAAASGINPRFNASYEPTGDLTLYAQIAKGFRPGGANPPATPPCASIPLQFDADGLWSYEIGEKARFFDRRLTLNGAVYFENWTRIQQSVSEECGNVYVANAGTAHVYGSELEATAKLTSALTLTNSAGYVHAFIADAAAGTSFVDGEAIQNVPRFTNTTFLEYTHPITEHDSLVLRATNVYTGSMTDISFMLNTIPSRDLLNLRAAWANDKKNLSVSLFVNNATDKRAYIADPPEVFVFVPALNRVVTNQPRTIGLDLTYGWGE
jgi:iron complex outermembrane recepter protein